MDNSFGINSQITETLKIMSNGWIWGFLIIGACLFAASWLVNWQVRRFGRILGRDKAEEGDAPDAGTSGSGRGETPRV